MYECGPLSGAMRERGRKGLKSNGKTVVVEIAKRKEEGAPNMSLRLPWFETKTSEDR